MPPSALDDVRLLLIQARTNPDMIDQEQLCFAERCRVDVGQIISRNVAERPVTSNWLEAADAVLIGGAGEYSAMDDHPWTDDLHALIKEAVDRAIPMFGSCWGHQVIARAFGGTVINDPERAELGSGTVELTDAGMEDPIFRSFPRRFRVNMGHHDRVSELPPTAVELAYNDSQRNQAFRLRDVPVYGTQFHSELDAERELERLIVYREYYKAEMPDEETFQSVISNLVETTEVDRLMHDFLVRFVVTD